MNDQYNTPTDEQETLFKDPHEPDFPEPTIPEPLPEPIPNPNPIPEPHPEPHPFPMPPEPMPQLPPDVVF